MTYFVAEDRMFVFVMTECEGGFGVEWRVESDEDRAVRVHGEVLELVHPV